MSFFLKTLERTDRLSYLEVIIYRQNFYISVNTLLKKASLTDFALDNLVIKIERHQNYNQKTLRVWLDVKRNMDHLIIRQFTVQRILALVGAEKVAVRVHKQEFFFHFYEARSSIQVVNLSKFASLVQEYARLLFSWCFTMSNQVNDQEMHKIGTWIDRLGLLIPTSVLLSYNSFR